MPFDYKEYQKKCDGLTSDQLQAEYENYTRQLAGGATSTATSVLFSPFTAGISLVGLGLSAPRVHNARKKREIIEAGLQARGETHHTRKRDVIAPVAVAGTLSGLTLGLAGPGADMIAGQVVGHGMEYVAAHVALDATGAVAEHKHDKHTHKKTHQKLQTPSQIFQQPGAVQSNVSLNQPGLQMPLPTSPKPPAPTVSQPDPPPAYQYPPQDQKYEVVSPSYPQNASVSYQPASHQQSFVQAAGEPQIPMYQPATYIPAQRSDSGFSSVSIPSELESPSVRISLPNLQTTPILPSRDTEYFPSQVQYAPVEAQLQPTSDKLGPKSDGPLHITVYELDSQPVVAAVEVDSSPPQLTMEQEIAFLKARILEMEIERREGANKSPSSTDQPPVQTSLGQNDISQVQLGPFEPELRITPALASLVEHQNFPQPPSSPAPGVASPTTPSIQYSMENSTSTTSYNSAPPPPASPALAVASEVIPSLQYPSDNQTSTTSLYPSPLRIRRHSAHIPGYQYASPGPNVTSPTTLSLQIPPENQPPTTSNDPSPRPPRPHSAHIPGYQYPPPSSPAPSVVSPITPSQQYPPQHSTPTTLFIPPPPPPRPHSAHIPDYQPPSPYSFASSSNTQQQQRYAPPPLPPRPQQQPPIQRQDSGYYSNPPSRHSSAFSTATVSTCSSPQSMLSPQSTGPSLLSPQSTGHSLRHSVSYGSISPLSPQPAPYFAPPPSPDPVARPLSQVKDYFSRPFARASPQIPTYQPGLSQPAQAPPPQFQDSQGWQWGTAPMQSNGQPQYGAPPPVPNAWKGS